MAIHPERLLTWRVQVAGTPDQVWKAWTDAREMVTWAAPAAEVDLRPGGTWEAQFFPDRPAGERGGDANAILEIGPGRRLVLAAGAPVEFPTVRREKTTFTVRVEPARGEGSMVTATQSGWKAGDEWDRAFVTLAHANAEWLSWLHRRFADGPVDWAEMGFGRAGSYVDAWRPDTASVYFAWARPGGSDIWFGRCGSEDPRQVTQGERANGPDLSPDGSKLLYVSVATGNREVMVLDLASGNRTNLTENAEEDLLPKWSPDGSSILFFSTRGEARGEQGAFRGNLFVMASDGSNPRRLTKTPLSSSFGGSWSPDGKSVLLARRSGGKIDLYVLAVDGSGERRLTTRPGDNYAGSFSPDGNMIAFHSAAGEESRIVVANADGSEIRELTSGGQHYVPQWSPNGRWLIFTGAPLGATRFGVLYVSVDGGAPGSCRSSEYDERDAVWAAPHGR